MITAATSDLFVPQAANWDVLGGVSFQKGCYPGQEIVARTQYLGRLKERLFAFRTEAEDVAPAAQLLFAGLRQRARRAAPSSMPRRTRPGEAAPCWRSSSRRRSRPMTSGSAHPMARCWSASRFPIRFPKRPRPARRGGVGGEARRCALPSSRSMCIPGTRSSSQRTATNSMRGRRRARIGGTTVQGRRCSPGATSSRVARGSA